MFTTLSHLVIWQIILSKATYKDRQGKDPTGDRPQLGFKPQSPTWKGDDLCMYMYCFIDSVEATDQNGCSKTLVHVHQQNLSTKTGQMFFKLLNCVTI